MKKASTEEEPLGMCHYMCLQGLFLVDLDEFWRIQSSTIEWGDDSQFYYVLSGWKEMVLAFGTNGIAGSFILQGWLGGLLFYVQRQGM